MRAAFAISGSAKQDVVAVASCWAGKSRGDGQPSCKLIGESIVIKLYFLEFVILKEITAKEAKMN